MRTPHLRLVALLALLACAVALPPGAAVAKPKPSPIVRFATFNASLNRNSAGQLIADLSTPDNAQARNVAEIIQRTNPDIVLINEFDYEPDLAAAKLFRENYLEVSQNGAAPIEFPYVYVAPSNTGIPSGVDLDNNGQVGGPNDAFGFGFFPGQFGMALFSKYPIATGKVRTFQTFLWKDMPGALLPDDPATPAPADWYSADELAIFRLSSKSHWDVPIKIGDEVVHALVSHPTPPVFDGPEDRNGTRNHDEIRFWADYIAPGQDGYIYDDRGKRGGLKPGERFVIMGDQNADPLDGDSVEEAILQLLDHPRVSDRVTPSSAGGPQQAALQGGANALHEGDPAFDTADFADTTPGNLRADYVLPSDGLRVVDAQVFWPLNTDPLFRLVGVFDPSLPGGFPSSDHRLVWVDMDVVPSVAPKLETQPILDTAEPPPGARAGDADDPAIWYNARNPGRSLVLAALKEGGLDVYDLKGNVLQSISPAGSRYNNVDVLHGFRLGRRNVDLAIASDRFKDNLAIYRIDPRSRELSDIGDPANPLIYTPEGQEPNQETTAYGLALYRSPESGKSYAFVTQRESNQVVQLELFATDAGKVGYRPVRTLTLPIPEGGELEDAQSEGMVADYGLAVLYVAQENVGIWKFAAEPDGDESGTLVDAAYPDGTVLKDDVEGLTIYYAGGRKGYLLASSQGDGTFAVYTRAGDNRYLGSFRVGAAGGVDSVEGSDGAAVISLPLGERFPKGLLVVHDGTNDPPFLVEDDGELENINTNFKFVPWERVARAFAPPLEIETGDDTAQE